jgi:hypothetical protein
MVRNVSTALVILGLVAVGLSARADETFGKGVSLAEATPIQALYEHPDAFIGKTIRVDGVIAAVCEDMGCWMALADIADVESIVRLKVEDGGGIVFPISAKGKAASAEGVFEKIAATDAEGNEAAAEQTAQASGKSVAFGTLYQIKATGAVVR